MDIIYENVDDKRYCRNIIERTASDSDYQRALKVLTEYLYKIYQKEVILIIDEYDMPIQSGWNYGFYEEAIDFTRGLFSGALKDNPCLFKGVLTGIYRVAKESIFSGLNNLKVYTVLDKKYSEYFGFTQNEVESLVESLKLTNDKEITSNLKKWYNGYNFGGNIIYNPWSVINFLYSREFKPYWINTSSNHLVISTIEKNLIDDYTFRQELEKLISGEKIDKKIDDASALRELEYDPDSIWALFLFSGYLKAEERHEDPITEETKYFCSIPNTEVTRFYKNTVVKWLRKANRNILSDMTNPLLQGNGEIFCEKLRNYVLDTLSYFDFQGNPENTYHLLLLGMFSHLSGGYWIKSNRESGLGRYDICLKAKNKENYSAIIEIKPSADRIQKAMKQIEDKEYVRELVSEGYTRILKVALGVDGKKIDTVVLENT
jgi:hypothetical protein